jgi:hypothetical protein
MKRRTEVVLRGCYVVAAGWDAAWPGIVLCHQAEATAPAFEREIARKPHKAAFFK